MAEQSLIDSFSIELLLIDLDQPPLMLDQMLAVLHPSERQRADRFVAARDRNRYIRGRYALRETLAARLNQPPQSLAIGEGPHGKPFLLEPAQFAFNLSHSQNRALLALFTATPSATNTAIAVELGVDIEMAQPLQDAQTLYRHCLCKREQVLLAGMTDLQRESAFFAIWARKEACLKALGLGFQVEPHRFDSGWTGRRVVQLEHAEPVRILQYPPLRVLDLDLPADWLRDPADEPSARVKPSYHAALALLGADTAITQSRRPLTIHTARWLPIANRRPALVEPRRPLAVSGRQG